MNTAGWKIIDTWRQCHTGHGDAGFRSMADVAVEHLNRKTPGRYQVVAIDGWLAEAYRKLDALLRDVLNDSADFVGSQHQRLEALIPKQ